MRRLLLIGLLLASTAAFAETPGELYDRLDQGAQHSKAAAGEATAPVAAQPDPAQQQQAEALMSKAALRAMLEKEQYLAVIDQLKAQVAQLQAQVKAPPAAEK